ncbi:hypothetical protein BDB01DRAFT_789314 [Pilobolus umbonatus]|nr:hypothetical protein BDB01DRAFT_789314 [Pilobolus umbonatus]
MVEYTTEDHSLSSDTTFYLPQAPLSPVAEDIDRSDYTSLLLPPDIEKRYIQQDLPVRRQSLCSYPTYIIPSTDYPHTNKSALLWTYPPAYSILDTNNYKEHTQYKDMSDRKTNSGRKRDPAIPLTIRTLPSQINNSNHSQSPISSSPSTAEYYSDVLSDEISESPTQFKPTRSKFMGRLRPSKSDTISTSNTIHIKREDTILSTTCQDRQLPLSRLRNALFSRLYSSTNISNHRNTICLSTKRSKQMVMSKVPDDHYHDELSPMREEDEKTSFMPVSTALLSYLSDVFIKSVCVTSVATQEDIEYHDILRGNEIIDCLVIILNSKDRSLCLAVGCALEHQGFIRHVNGSYKLRDTESEYYQCPYLNQQRSWHYHFNAIEYPTHHKSCLITYKTEDPVLCNTSPINGIFTPLTACYSPTCDSLHPCYSISCPRNTKYPKIRSLSMPESVLSSDQEKKKNSPNLWRYSVPLNIVTEVTGREIKRQECIHELIYTEEDLTNDLHYIQNDWIKSLESNDIIPLERRQEFITHVFWNINAIEQLSCSLTKELKYRQNKHSIIPYIGDIMLSHAKKFEPFVTYGSHQVIGKYYFEQEKKDNPVFAQFTKSLEHQPESRRLDLNAYLTKPTARLGKYNLLLNAIHQFTPNDNRDYTLIPQIINIITDFLTQLNENAGTVANTFHLQQLTMRILQSTHLKLLDEKRQLIMKGKMRRKMSSMGNNTTSADIQVFLFDHCIVFCKIKYVDQVEYYKIYQKSIPIQNLSVTIPKPAPIKSLSSSTSLLYNKLSPTGNKRIESLDCHPIPIGGYPIVFQDKHASPPVLPIHLTTSNEATRKLWVDKIEEMTGKSNLFKYKTKINNK